MAQEFIEYKVIVNTASGEAKFELLSNAAKQTKKNVDDLGNSLDKTSKNNAQLASKAGLAGAVVVELGRTVSDANYGMTAMANNIQQLSSLFVTLLSKSEGALNGLKALGSALFGPLGIIVLVQSLITYIERLSKQQEELTKTTNTLATAYGNAGTEYEVLLEKVKSGQESLTKDEIKNVELRIQALKAEALIRAQIAEIQRIQAEKIKVERSAAEDNVAWYQQFWSYIKSSGLSALGGQIPSPTADFVKEMTTLGEEEKQNRIDELDKQIQDIIESVDVDQLNKLIEGDGEGKDGKKKKLDFLAGTAFGAVFDDELLNEYKTRLQLWAEAGLSSSAKKSEKELEILNNQLEGQRKINDSLVEDSTKSAEEITEARVASLDAVQRMLNAVGDTFAAFSQLAEEDSKKQKKLAAAGAVIDTLASIVATIKNATKSGAPPWVAVAQSIGIGLIGYANVKKILAVDPTGSNLGSGINQSTPQQAPTFNIVGTSGASQLREAVEGGLNRPIKAYVTQKDISTSAELERSTRKTASII